MRQKSKSTPVSSEGVVRDIRLVRQNSGVTWRAHRQSSDELSTVADLIAEQFAILIV
jgi:hypothetical protein